MWREMDCFEIPGRESFYLPAMAGDGMTVDQSGLVVGLSDFHRRNSHSAQSDDKISRLFYTQQPSQRAIQLHNLLGYRVVYSLFLHRTESFGVS